MRVIVAGSRSIKVMAYVERAIEESGFKITTLLSGCAEGVDKLGEEWAEKRGIPVLRFHPDWKRGSKAGNARNNLMAGSAEAVIIVWNGVSRGTGDMLRIAKIRKLPYYVFRINKIKAL